MHAAASAAVVPGALSSYYISVQENITAHPELSAARSHVTVSHRLSSYAL